MTIKQLEIQSNTTARKTTVLIREVVNGTDSEIDMMEQIIELTEAYKKEKQA